MAIFYVDHVFGDDSRDGSTWGLAWKTLTGGATAGKLNAGDTIRIAKTPDPTLVGIASWTNLSQVITLTTAVTANIDTCVVAWTASTNVVTTTTAVRKEGSLACDIAIGSSFDSGKVAYKTITDTDFSTYQQISFWIRATAVTTALQICLCSDTVGNVAVDTFTLPSLSAINKWYPITIDKGSNLGSSIKSISLYAVVDPGIVTISLDNIIACKAASSSNSLSLKSLISKCQTSAADIDSWYCIQSINDTTIYIDNDPLTVAGNGRGYTGITESIDLYKRETCTITTTETLSKSGTDGSLVNYIFGVNTSNNIQDGETFIDGVYGVINGITCTTKSFISVSGVSCVRCGTAVIVTGCSYSLFTLGSLCNSTIGLNVVSSVAGACVFLVKNTCNNLTYGTTVDTVASYLELSRSNGNLSYGVYVATGVLWKIKIGESKNNTGYGLYLSACDRVQVTINTAYNTLGGVWCNFKENYLNKSTLAETVEVAGIVDYSGTSLRSTLHDNTPMYNKVFTDGGLIVSQTAVRQTAIGVAWKMSPTSVNRNSYYPLTLRIALVAVAANIPITINTWFLRDSMDITGKLFCAKEQLSGLTADTVATMTAAINIWEELSISLLPTENGVVEIYAQAYGGTVNSVYIDSMRFS